VKFHVSAMLEKFGIRSRMGLLMKAGDCLAQEAVERRGADPESVAIAGDGGPVLTGPTPRPRLMIPMAGRAGR
jgi:hypothetical protein